MSHITITTIANECKGMSRGSKSDTLTPYPVQSDEKTGILAYTHVTKWSEWFKVPVHRSTPEGRS